MLVLNMKKPKTQRGEMTYLHICINLPTLVSPVNIKVLEYMVILNYLYSGTYIHSPGKAEWALHLFRTGWLLNIEYSSSASD